MSSSEKSGTDTQKAAPKVQGEGDYESARRYDKDAQEFAKQANVEDLARRAAPKTDKEAEEMKKAEAVGLSHRKDTSPKPSH